MCTAWSVLVSLLTISLSCTHSDGSDAVERTLAMIKPDGVRANHTNDIMTVIQAEGFKIVAEKETCFDEAAAQSFYKEHSKRTFFPHLVKFMTSGPLRAMVLERENAINDWRTLMGPTDSNKARLQAPNSVRSRFGLDGQSNCVHGSDSPEAAAREIASFFDSIAPAADQRAQRTTGTHDEL